VGSGSARRGETGGESGGESGGDSGGDSGNKSGGDSGGESSNKSRGDPQSQSGSDSRNRSASGADNEQGSDSPRAASGATGNEARVRPQGTPLAALLTADIEAPVERILLSRDREMLRAQVLVVPHHGSKTSSTEPFLDSIDPLVALFQVGYRNRFHHPSAGVLARYSARQIELGRSDADGAVRVEIDPDFAARRGPRAPAAALTIERYRDTHRRYWMDR
jgi:competence protein ComEC